MRLFLRFGTSALVVASLTPSAIAAEGSASRLPLLAALDGQWTMIGDVMGKPVQYDMEAFPALQGTFTEIHVIDVGVPVRYGARVFIGIEESSKAIPHLVQYAQPESNAFDDLVSALRASPEWQFVDRDVDVRLVRAAD